MDTIKWFIASTQKWFKEQNQTNVKIFFQNQETVDLALPERAEIRVDGPKFQAGMGSGKISGRVNILITCNQSPTNPFRYYELADAFKDMLIDIPIFKLGSQVTDDKSRLTCWQRETEVYFVDLAAPRDTSKVSQCSLTADYSVEL